MRKPLTTICTLLAIALLTTIAPAAVVKWNDGDGLSGEFTAATWDNLQAAITGAEGGGSGGGGTNAGWVKIHGDLERVSGTDIEGDLAVANGNLKISGGWLVDVNGDFTVQSGRSTLNVHGGSGSSDRHRVVTLTGSDATLDGLRITGGGGHYGTGQGVYMAGSGNRLSNCEITGNRQHYAHSSHTGGGIYVQGGSSTTPQVIEGCKITDNEVGTGTSGGGIYAKGYLVVANCEITGNTARTSGAGIYLRGHQARFLVFGSLIAGNGNYDSSGVQGAGAYVYGYSGDANFARFANCTIADNVDSTDSDSQGVVGSPGYGNATAATFINTILSENQGTEMSRTTSSRTVRARFQHATIYEPTGSEVYYQIDVPSGDESTNSLATALWWNTPTEPPDPDSLFHSVDDSGADQQTIQNELTTDPSFLGSGSDPYQLVWGSTSRDNGLLRTGAHADITGSFLYVDTDMDYVGDGAGQGYDAAWDVIVDLQGATVNAGLHLVYETDLLGNARVFWNGIDRGAYEAVPEPATMALLGLGFAGLAAVRRRRRRA